MFSLVGFAMSSEEDDAIVLIASVLSMRRRKRRKRLWVHPYLGLNADTHSAYIVSQQLQMHPQKFQNFYRMKKETFNELVDLMRPSMQLQDTNYRRAITVEERLLIFLRFIATGMIFTALHFEFYRGISTISSIVANTAEKLWTILQPKYMALPTMEQWQEISDRYYELWNMPNCLGSLDGKHVRIKCPKKSGSGYYNYKGYFSIVLMAISDADGLFTLISVGDYGKNSDGRVIKSSGFFHALTENLLNIPPPAVLPNDEVNATFPMFFVGDEAFPLHKNIMRPYPRRTLTNPKRIFNYRLSRARKSVECAFGMLVSKFKIFETQIDCGPEIVVKIVKAACILHNYIRKRDGRFSNPNEQDVGSAYNVLPPLQQELHGRQETTVGGLRDRLCDYFMKPENTLPWQNNVCI